MRQVSGVMKKNMRKKNFIFTVKLKPNVVDLFVFLPLLLLHQVNEDKEMRWGVCRGWAFTFFSAEEDNENCLCK